MLFSDLGPLNCCIGYRVAFVAIWVGKSQWVSMPGCAETIINTVVFVRFHFSSCLVNWVSSERLLDLFLVVWGLRWPLFLAFEGLGSMLEI